MTSRLCLVYQSNAPVVSSDAMLLSERYAVDSFEYRGLKDVPSLFRGVGEADLTISWFALGHATATVLLSKFFHRPSVVFIGGWDVAAMPEIPYGAMLSATRRRKTIWTLQNSDIVLAPSDASRQETLRWTNREVQVLPLGVDTDFFQPPELKEVLVVTAASVSYSPTIRTKGLDVLFQVARHLPETQFVIAGRQNPQMLHHLQMMAGPNVQFVGWLEREDLRALFRRANVYAQLSAHESFGLALAEAMACGCTPVVSDRGALPEVVGDAGSVVAYGDITAATRAISAALVTGISQTPRNRIMQAFPLSRRRDELLRILEALT